MKYGLHGKLGIVKSQPVRNVDWGRTSPREGREEINGGQEKGRVESTIE